MHRTAWTSSGATVRPSCATLARGATTVLVNRDGRIYKRTSRRQRGSFPRRFLSRTIRRSTWTASSRRRVAGRGSFRLRWTSSSISLTESTKRSRITRVVRRVHVLDYIQAAAPHVWPETQQRGELVLRQMASVVHD